MKKHAYRVLGSVLLSTLFMSVTLAESLKVKMRLKCEGTFNNGAGGMHIFERPTPDRRSLLTLDLESTQGKGEFSYSFWATPNGDSLIHITGHKNIFIFDSSSIEKQLMGRILICADGFNSCNPNSVRGWILTVDSWSNTVGALQDGGKARFQIFFGEYRSIGFEMISKFDLFCSK